jgi:hypothetical protein
VKPGLLPNVIYRNACRGDNRRAISRASGDFARDARAEYRNALAILEELYGPGSIENISVLIGLAGLNLGGYGEPDAEYLLEALSIQKEAAPDDLLAYSDLAIEAGKLMTRADPTREQAIEILSPLLKELEREFGRESAELVPVLMVLGRDLLYMSRTDSEEHYLTSAYETFDEQLGADHELTATAQMSLGELKRVAWLSDFRSTETTAPRTCSSFRPM